MRESPPIQVPKAVQFDAQPPSLNRALGRHLELLGQALQRESAGAAAPNGGGLTEESTDETVRDDLDGLRAALGCSVDALARELCSADAAKAQSEEPSKFDPTSPLRSVRSTSMISQEEGCDNKSDYKSECDSESQYRPRRTPQQKGTGQSVASTLTDGSMRAKRTSSQRWDDVVLVEKSWWEQIVTGWHFEMCFAVLIALNTVAMIIEEQWRGSVMGHELNWYKDYGAEWYNEQYMPGAKDTFKFVEIVFAAVFTLEALMRMIGRGRGYWNDKAELLDLFVVVCSITSLLAENFSAMKITLFRILRLTKLLRMVKLIRTVEQLDSLQLMTTALYASISALCWAVVLLFIMQSFMALILTSVFRSEYLTHSSLDLEQKHQLFEYFGTYARSMLSTFELMLANWPPICRFLTENLHEAWMVFVIAYKLTFGFAIVGVINAVFMQETLNVAVTDDNIMIKTRTRAAAIHRRKMEKLMKLADTNRDSQLSQEEFEAVLDNPSVKSWLESMDLETRDARLLFRLMDRNDDRSLSLDELTVGFAKLKGLAKSVDTQLIIQAMLRQWFPGNMGQVDALLLNETSAVFSGPHSAGHTPTSNYRPSGMLPSPNARVSQSS